MWKRFVTTAVLLPAICLLLLNGDGSTHPQEGDTAKVEIKAGPAPVKVTLPSEGSGDQPSKQIATVEALMLKSPLIFRGTVTSLDAKGTKLVPPGEKAVTVRVDVALRLPRFLGKPADFKGPQAEIILLPRDGMPALAEGQQAIFLGNVQMAGSKIVAAEVYRFPLGGVSKMAHQIMDKDGKKSLKIIEDSEKHIEALVQDLPKMAFQARGVAADLVTTGKVLSVVTAPLPPGAQPRISEHDPKWRLAIVETQTVIQSRAKGQEPKRIGILFPSTRDVRFRDVPRFDIHSAGAWNLRATPVANTFMKSKHLHAVAADDVALPIYTAVNKDDFYPIVQTHLTNVPAEAPAWLFQKSETLFEGKVPPAKAPVKKLEKTSAKAAKKGDDPAVDKRLLVINMIPRSASDEVEQDSEPFLAVHPQQRVLLGSAFTPSTHPGAAPVYVSADGGESWALNFTLPSDAIADQTFSFDTDKGGTLFSSIIKRPALTVPILSTTDPDLAQVMQVISDLDTLDGDIRADQPFVQARAIGNKSRIYVGENNFDPTLTFGTASVRMSTDSGQNFRSIGLEQRTTLGQDAPSVRPAVARDGTVYAAFMSWKSRSPEDPDKIIGDVVVCRDDLGATGATVFNSLLDSGDQKPGKIVARNRVFPWNQQLGQERTGSSLSLAVDPNHSETVFIAWADQDSTSSYTIHVRRSTDKGKTWTSDLRTIPSATNPALAVAEDGTVALLYQQLAKRGTSKESWETHLLRSKDGFANIKDVVLARTPTAGEPTATFVPYMGDYAHLLAIKNTFYGIFSTANAPVKDNFPSGVKFQRNVKNGRLRNLAGTDDIQTSIDPFFFRLPTEGETMDLSLTTTPSKL